MTGRLIGIARRHAPMAINAAVNHATIAIETGVTGNFRGALVPDRSNKRQVTIVMASDWATANAELGAALGWTLRRCDLLIEGLYLPRDAGYRVRLGAAVVEVTGECWPCSRMEEVAPGLKAALSPDWRGGRTARVVGGGEIRLGDTVALEEVP